MKTAWFAFVAFLGCSPSVVGGGSESNFVKCKSTSNCPSGLVCNANQCERVEAGARSSAGGRPASGGMSTRDASPNGGAGGTGNGGGGRRVTGADASVGGDATSSPEAAVHADARRDGRVDLDASPTEACFDVAPAACGAIAMWSPASSSNGWNVWRAVPIEGADGFAVLMYHGQFGAADSYAFATLGADGGCAKLVAPPWSGSPPRFTAVGHSVSRGGTFALVGACVTRYPCGATLFLNGVEWADPAGATYFLDVDVASDGRALVVASFPGDSATSTNSIERWLSPTGQILAERRLNDFAVSDVRALDDGTIALAVSRSDGTSFVQFQSATLDSIATWHPGTTRLVGSLAQHFPLLAVAGVVGTSGTWTGVIDTQTLDTIWTHAWTPSDSLSPQDVPLALELEANGALNAALWPPFGRATHLLLHDAKDAPGTITAPFDPSYAPGPARYQAYGGIRTQPDGRILFSTDFAGTYCEKD